MIAGLPGIGISGIFYLICAFLMPIIEIKNTLRRRSSRKRWKMAATQFSFFLGIIGSSLVTGIILGKIVQKFSVVITPKVSTVHIQDHSVFRVQQIFISLLTLFVVFASLQIFNYFRDRKFSQRKKT